jgi:hypothetical protein
MPTAPENTKLKEAGAVFLSDMAKQSAGSGGVTLANSQLRAARGRSQINRAPDVRYFPIPQCRLFCCTAPGKTFRPSRNQHQIAFSRRGDA